MLKRKDLWLIGILVTIAAGILLIFPLSRKSQVVEETLYLRYRLNEQEAKIVPLVREEQLILNQQNGVQNVLFVWPGGIRMDSSTCHNQLCVYQGEVTLENRDIRPLQQLIVCAPHRLVAELLTAEEVQADNAD